MSTEKEPTPPSRADMIAFYKEQIEYLEVQHCYATLRKEIQEAEAARLEAIAKIAFFQGKLNNDSVPEVKNEKSDE